jgi:cobalamin 5'-phosphate synthase/cobalamin synthase
MSLRSEFDLFIDAMQLLTRLPTPAKAAPSADAIARSARYFPVVGMIVGALAACVLLTAGLRLTGALPALLAIAAGALITGGFHEDGVADTADALGGGQSREQRLMIMKDSRIGTYGALALGLSAAIRVLALAAIAPPLAAGARRWSWRWRCCLMAVTPTRRSSSLWRSAWGAGRCGSPSRSVSSRCCSIRPESPSLRFWAGASPLAGRRCRPDG